jgi:hypothetical protein
VAAAACVTSKAEVDTAAQSSGNEKEKKAYACMHERF